MFGLLTLFHEKIEHLFWMYQFVSSYMHELANKKVRVRVEHSSRMFKLSHRDVFITVTWNEKVTRDLKPFVAVISPHRVDYKEHILREQKSFGYKPVNKPNTSALI